MKKLSLVIFDMDGLLIDSERGMWIVNQKRVAEEFGFEFHLDFTRTLMGSGIDYFSAKLAEHYGNGFSVDKFKSRIMKYNDEYIYGNKIKPMKGAYELLDYLQSINMPMCVATSSKRKIAKQF